MAMFLARIVIPRSRSWGLESRMQSPWSWLARYWPDCRSMASTSVVLPWSTCAMMATLRMSLRRVMVGFRPPRGGLGDCGRSEGIGLRAVGIRAGSLIIGEYALHDKPKTTHAAPGMGSPLV